VITLNVPEAAVSASEKSGCVMEMMIAVITVTRFHGTVGQSLLNTSVPNKRKHRYNPHNTTVDRVQTHTGHSVA